MKKKMAAFLLIILIPLSGHAKELASEKEIQALLDNAMENFAEGNIETAMKSLEPFILIDKKEFKSLTLTIVEQRAFVEDNYGAGRGWELVSVTTFGESLMEFMYFSIHEKYALRWYFTLYNNGNGWEIINLSYDDKIMNLFPR